MYAGRKILHLQLPRHDDVENLGHVFYHLHAGFLVSLHTSKDSKGKVIEFAEGCVGSRMAAE